MAETGENETRGVVGRRGAVPLYHQLFLTLRDEITSGQRAYGSAVPTEQELAHLHGVSRITARRCLEELANSGLVERRRRTGTRVIFQTPVRPLEANIDQAVDSLVAFGKNTQVRVVDIGEEPAAASIAQRFGVPVGTALVRAVRVRSMDALPLGEVVSYVPARLGPLITRENLTTTPMLALLRGAGVSIGHARQTISAISADAALTATLEVEARAPLLRIERLVRDAAGMPILLTVAHYRADRYHITLDLGAGDAGSLGASVRP
ncbi:GntR family transcriptional regulator [Nitrospirillum sp. BR 11164]|uniref:GntR family transcriptional regulator n=1 Tax=Nitrospirillum sp. BR 11164 TaxID=3104324 RepID=UPI002AFF5BFE|nr:GntR family transcriptional regulator [Nitrospirillum sp. BR 11164]MEA1648074.1 GntR family transcriptional regulator [Nitrospirillum sp. BR 11164]